MAGRLARFLRERDGIASVEFALMFPIVMYFFMLGAEIGLLQLQQVMFNRGVEIVARSLRLGNPELDDADALKSAVCDATLVIPNCRRDLTLQMSPVTVEDFDFGPGTVDCQNRSEPIDPVLRFDQGQKNEVMLLRFCVLYDPIFPGAGLGKRLPKVPGGGFAMTSTTFFVNEP